MWRMPAFQDLSRQAFALYIAKSMENSLGSLELFRYKQNIDGGLYAIS